VQQATTSEGLAQSSYEVARVGFDPATLRVEGTELTPSRKTMVKFCTFLEMPRQNPTPVETRIPSGNVAICIGVV